MATASTLADEHQAGQAALVTLVPDVMRQAWPMLDPHDIEGTLPRFFAAVRAITARYGRASAAASLDYYRQARSLAGVTGRASLGMADGPTADVVENAVRFAISDLYGPVTDKNTDNALQAVNSATAELVLDQGRRTLIEATVKDPKAQGWARVTEPDACSFCLMLALRAGAGLLYRSKRGANFRAHTKRPNGSGGECRCHVEPVFTAYEPPARVREAQALYQQAKAAKLPTAIAFRRLVEGRTLT